MNEKKNKSLRTITNRSTLYLHTVHTVISFRGNLSLKIRKQTVQIMIILKIVEYLVENCRLFIEETKQAWKTKNNSYKKQEYAIRYRRLCDQNKC